MAVGGTRGSTSAGSPPWTSTTPSQRSFPFSRRRWPIRPAHVAWLDTCGVKWKGGSGRPACRRPIRARPHGRLEDRRCFTRLSTQLYAGLEKNARRTSQRIEPRGGDPEMETSCRLGHAAALQAPFPCLNWIATSDVTRSNPYSAGIFAAALTCRGSLHGEGPWGRCSTPGFPRQQHGEQRPGTGDLMRSS